jgi:hypothetical protein
MFVSYHGSTDTFPAYASPCFTRSVSTIFCGNLFAHKPCLQSRWLGKSATIAWWRYFELQTSTGYLIAYSDGRETVAHQTPRWWYGCSVCVDVRISPRKFPRNAKHSKERTSDFQFGLTTFRVNRKEICFYRFQVFRVSDICVSQSVVF